jgi:hypothetical protein
MNTEQRYYRTRNSLASLGLGAVASSARNRSQSRPAHRERDFGVGYGSSSGYARDSRYAESWAKLPFRCC